MESVFLYDTASKSPARRFIMGGGRVERWGFWGLLGLVVGFGRAGDGRWAAWIRGGDWAWAVFLVRMIARLLGWVLDFTLVRGASARGSMKRVLTMGVGSLIYGLYDIFGICI